MKLQKQTVIYAVTYTCGHAQTKRERLLALTISPEEARKPRHQALQAVVKCAEYR